MSERNAHAQRAAEVDHADLEVGVAQQVELPLDGVGGREVPAADVDGVEVDFHRDGTIVDPAGVRSIAERGRLPVGCPAATAGRAVRGSGMPVRPLFQQTTPIRTV